MLAWLCLIALKANIPPSLKSPSKATPPECIRSLLQQRFPIPVLAKLQRISPAQGVGSKEHCVGSMSIGTQFMHVVLFYELVIWFRCVNQARACKILWKGGEGGLLGDDVSCLYEQGVQRYANTYVDRKIGKTIKMLEPSVLIGRTFLGPMPSTEYINTFRLLNLMIAIGMWRDFQRA